MPSRKLTRTAPGAVRQNTAVDSAQMPGVWTFDHDTPEARLNDDYALHLGAGKLEVGTYQLTDTQWGYLGALDQAIDSSATVEFVSAEMTGLRVSQVQAPGEIDSYVGGHSAGTSLSGYTGGETAGTTIDSYVGGQSVSTVAFLDLVEFDRQVVVGTSETSGDVRHVLSVDTEGYALEEHDGSAWQDRFSVTLSGTAGSRVADVATGTITVASDIRHSGDTDTKIAFTTDEIAFDTGGTTALTIDSSQRVGIGVSPSTNILTLGYDGFGNTRIQFNSSNNSNSNGKLLWNGFRWVFEDDAGTNIVSILDGATADSIYVGSSSVDFMGGYGSSGVTISSSGDLSIDGALTKGSGSFNIDHPLKPDTHRLVHSFVEAPKADLIYRGRVKLVDGKAGVSMDKVAGMTEGTFEVLCRDVDVFVTAQDRFERMRGFVVGDMLYIESENLTSDAMVSFLVIGERKDAHMYETAWTDEEGHVIVEPRKEQKDGNGN